MNDAPAGRTLRLMDLTALVVGYGLAALLVRAVWGLSESMSVAAGGLLALCYGWLGLAMSGPVVLLFDRRALGRREPERPTYRLVSSDEPVGRRPAPASTPPQEPGRFTWAELAWLLIGLYWILITLLVVPARLRGASPSILVFMNVVGVLWLVTWLFGTHRPPPPNHHPGWTHRAAVGLLVSWPVTWGAMILLTRV